MTQKLRALALFVVIGFLTACQHAANIQSGYLDQIPRVVSALGRVRGDPS